MSSQALYDRIGGLGYTKTRQPDPRIAAAIRRALGDAQTVANVGAGAGSYEPEDCKVVAIDPSVVMLAQRPATAAPAVIGVAESLPLVDRAVDASLAVLTIHHWNDPRRGVEEMKRISRRRVVIFTCDPVSLESLWLSAYFPFEERDTVRFPQIGELVDWLGMTRVERVEVPADCIDGFGSAFWNRPEAYLDEQVRAGISSFRMLSSDQLDRGVARLREDLASGAWDDRYGELRERSTFDVGCRLLVCELDRYEVGSN